jgi:RNA polymerase nonessential primary-like sigma factor
VTELAQFVDLPEDEVKYLMCRARQPVSLEMKVGDGDDTELLELLSGDNELPSDQVEEDCLKGDLRSLLGQLPHLQEQVLRMRFGMDGEDPMSLTGIGRILGMSRDRVRNLERDGLAGLRRVSDQVEAYVAC